MILDLTPAQLLITTRAVPKRLDLDLPIPHTIGTEFRPAGRRDTATVAHWDRW